MTSQTLNVANLPTDLFIGGQWINPSSQARIDVFDPSTQQVIASVADASLDDAHAAVEAAAKAAPAWAATPARARSEILRRCFELMIRDKEKLAILISMENGKSLNDALGEVAYAAEFFRWFAEEAVRIEGDFSRAPSGLARTIVQYEPIGIALLVTPWNFPAAMATRKIAPALAAGCTCILKPATETPLTAYLVAQILAEAGVPDGVVNVITTRTSGKVCSQILDDDRVRKLSFTGSTEVGRVLLRKAADSVVNCSMELGGNAPFLVFDDADIDVAIEGAMIAKMRNGGEACTAANRFYVQRGIAAEFSKRFAERMAALRVDDGAKIETQCGPLINAGAVEKVASLVDDAVTKGAILLAGGNSPDRVGYFYNPTVLMNVPANADLLKEEIFGPVAPIVVFDHEDEAVEAANATEYGLMAYVFTRDVAKGMRISERLESGMIGLNRGVVSDPAAPFGGVKQSGLGREGAHHGMLEFLEAKYISVNW
ncbi:NAD-dependent succinate-semialdehyde dehydrogenase [Pseudomonas putida]|uniref:NAD-dependent succinate-semialdehyde dehydrogenase n=1 Tax=Pseudomonas putida TaxID=303 RepID=UPI0007C0D2D8|nr:NAD-dependent succinate-semialdehyde dehydrogenase [Pseudomonas putida]ANC80212.1 NAD-dependent succinate-semialdehyde dehydrogenase [Pseudomonas putida B6-2]